MTNTKEYMREYRIKNREKLNEYNKKYHREHPEKIKAYWKENKEKLYKQNREWQKENSKKFSKLCQASRRRRVEKLRSQGITNPWAVIAGAEPKYK